MKDGGMHDGRPSEARDDRRAILVVHHDPELRELVGDTLRDDGHELDFATSGPVAVMRASVKQPDVVIVDLSTPATAEPSAFVTEMIRRFFPAPTVVALSMSRASAWALLGVSILLVKPVGVATLRRAVNLAARLGDETSRRRGSGLRRSVRPSRVLVFAGALDSPALEGVLGDGVVGAQLVVAESEADALALMEEAEPTLLVAGARGCDRARARAAARGIAVRIVGR